MVQPTTVAQIPHSASEIPSMASTDNLIVTEKTPLVKADGDAASLGQCVFTASVLFNSLPYVFIREKNSKIAGNKK